MNSVTSAALPVVGRPDASGSSDRSVQGKQVEVVASHLRSKGAERSARRPEKAAVAETESKPLVEVNVALMERLGAGAVANDAVPVGDGVDAPQVGGLAEPMSPLGSGRLAVDGAISSGLVSAGSRVSEARVRSAYASSSVDLEAAALVRQDPEIMALRAKAEKEDAANKVQSASTSPDQKGALNQSQIENGAAERKESREQGADRLLLDAKRAEKQREIARKLRMEQAEKSKADRARERREKQKAEAVEKKQKDQARKAEHKRQVRKEMKAKARNLSAQRKTIERKDEAKALFEQRFQRAEQARPEGRVYEMPIGFDDFSPKVMVPRVVNVFNMNNEIDVERQSQTDGAKVYETTIDLYNAEILAKFSNPTPRTTFENGAKAFNSGQNASVAENPTANTFVAFPGAQMNISV